MEPQLNSTQVGRRRLFSQLGSFLINLYLFLFILYLYTRGRGYKGTADCYAPLTFIYFNADSCKAKRIRKKLASPPSSSLTGGNRKSLKELLRDTWYTTRRHHHQPPPPPPHLPRTHKQVGIQIWYLISIPLADNEFFFFLKRRTKITKKKS